MYISEVAKELKISKKAIELYEQKGLFTPSKDISGYRVYHEQEINQLKHIQLLRKMDFTLSEIKRFLIDHDDSILDLKKEKLLKEDYRIQTIIQYYDTMKQSFHQDNMEDTRDELFKTLEIYEDETIQDDFKKLQSFPLNNLFEFLAYLNFFVIFIYIIGKDYFLQLDTLFFFTFIFLAIALSIKKSPTLQLHLTCIYEAIRERKK